MLKNKDGEIVKLIIDRKVWEVTRKMANATISLAKRKYKEEGVNAIVAVEKDKVISLQKDVYNDTSDFEKAVNGWTSGGYKCYSIKSNSKGM